jgi:hypothetical protein
MARLRAISAAAATTALLLVGGCQTVGSCKHPLTDADAPDDAPLRIPVGLDGPDTSSALEIPPLNEPEVPRGPDDPCIQDPPPMKEAGSAVPGGEEADEAANAPVEKPKRRRPVSPPR